MSKKNLLFFIVINCIWAAHPTIAKFLMQSFQPFQVAFFRYSFALATFWLYSTLLKTSKTELGPPFLWNLPQKISGGDWFKIFLMGFFVFCFSSLLQMSGLSNSRATDNALIIAMEPLATVFFAWIFLNQALGLRNVLAYALAILGFLLLIEIHKHTNWLPFSQSADPTGTHSSLKGNLLLLLSLTGEASFSVLGVKLLKRYPPFSIFGTILLIGVCLIIPITLFTEGLPDFSLLDFKNSLAIFVMGFIGTTIGYVYWLTILPKTPIANLSLTLFIQPLMGAFLGYAFLGERLSLIQCLGGALILASVTSVTVTSVTLRK